MINVLVVEDERPTARVIGKLVEQNPAFSVVGIECNGERALQFLKAHAVDLVITDIQMPVMDGLQLLAAIREQYPQCLTVLLTGFSQFEYAKTALQYRAFDYLLKPVDRVPLNQTLQKVEAAWREQSYAREHTMLEQCLAGSPPNSSSPKRYRMMLIMEQPGLAHSNSAAHWKKAGYHLFGTVLDQGWILIADVTVWNPDPLLASLSLSPPVNLIYCSNAIALEDLAQTVRQLQSHLEQQAVLFRSNRLTVDATKPLPSCRTNPLGQMQPEQAVEAICAQDTAGLEACLNRMWQISREGGYLRCQVFSYLEAILMDNRISRQLPPTSLIRIKSRLQHIVITSQSEAECTAQLKQELSQLRRGTSSHRDMEALVEEIAQYLDSNYHLNISIEALAKQYGFVPNHLNKVFKQYKNMRPSEYLLDLRIRRAQHMLETKPDIMVKDVAASVGYHDHHYFSKVFHRATGHWPTEYQQSSHKS